MLLSRKLDDKEIQLKNQSQIFFQISGAGHEAVLVAAGLHAASRATTGSIPYYRDRALCLQLGITPLEMLLAAVGAKDDPSSGGRQMPSHWGHTELNIVSRLEPDRHAGAAGGRRRRSGRHLQPRHGDSPIATRASSATRSSTSRSAKARRARASSGKSLNTACIKQPAGAVPRRRQRLRDLGAGRSADARRRHLAPRALASRPARRLDRRHRLLRQPRARCARRSAYVRARKGPALVHAHVIRPYSHSLSDDEKLYKTPAEREAEARRDPIARFARVPARRNGLATDEELAAIAADVEREVNDAAAAGARGAEAGQEHRRRSGSTRPTSIRPRPRSTRRRSPRASPTRWSRRSTAR